MNEVTLDGWASAEVLFTVRCPDCKSPMQTDPLNGSWTEANSLVVIPVVCKGCGYSGSVHFILSDGAALLRLDWRL